MSVERTSVDRDEQVESFIKEASEQLSRMRRHIKNLAERNHVLTQPAGEEYTFRGEMGVRGAFIVTEVDGYALVGPTRLNFSGHTWGCLVIVWCGARMGRFSLICILPARFRWRWKKS